MRLQDLTSAEIIEALRHTEQSSGIDSAAAVILRRELTRRDQYAIGEQQARDQEEADGRGLAVRTEQLNKELNPAVGGTTAEDGARPSSRRSGPPTRRCHADQPHHRAHETAAGIRSVPVVRSTFCLTGAGNVNNGINLNGINLIAEQPITLGAARELPELQRDGKPPTSSTMYRWSDPNAGCRGVVLETVQVGGSRCTTREALHRFIERLTTSVPDAEAHVDRSS